MTEPTRTTGWCQLNLTCDHGQAAEQMAGTHIRALLTDAEDALSAVSSANTDTTARADQLRAALADYINSWGTCRTPQVDAAFRTEAPLDLSRESMPSER